MDRKYSGKWTSWNWTFIFYFSLRIIPFCHFSHPTHSDFSRPSGFPTVSSAEQFPGSFFDQVVCKRQFGLSRFYNLFSLCVSNTRNKWRKNVFSTEFQMKLVLLKILCCSNTAYTSRNRSSDGNVSFEIQPKMQFIGSGFTHCLLGWIIPTKGS